MRIPVIVLSVLALVAALVPGLQAADEGGDKLTFKAHHSAYTAEGEFHKWRFTKVEIPDGQIEKGQVEFEIELASVWEKAAELAAHLRNADFFDVDKFPTAVVKIDGAEKIGEDTYRANSMVTLHGKTAQVPVEFKVVSRDPLKIDGKATLDRNAFEIGKPYDGSKYSIVNDVEIGFLATLTPQG